MFYRLHSQGGYLEAADGADTRRQQYLQLKSLSIDSQKEYKWHQSLTA